MEVSKGLFRLAQWSNKPTSQLTRCTRSFVYRDSAGTNAYCASRQGITGFATYWYHGAATEGLVAEVYAVRSSTKLGRLVTSCACTCVCTWRLLSFSLFRHTSPQTMSNIIFLMCLELRSSEDVHLLWTLSTNLNPKLPKYQDASFREFFSRIQLDVNIFIFRGKSL